MNSFVFMRFLSIKKYSKILRIKIKSVYVKDFLISTKVRLKRMEHLHSEEFFSCELYFRTHPKSGIKSRVLIFFNTIYAENILFEWEHTFVNMYDGNFLCLPNPQPVHFCILESRLVWVIRSELTL